MNQEFIALRNHIESLLAKKLRYDSRKIEEYREIKIETGVINQANGSARIRIGETDVLVGVKLDVGKPFPDTDDEGALMVAAELTPIADPEFEPGPPRDDAIELSRVVDRAIRESKMIDLKKLCIEKGEKSWIVFVDAIILNNDGNLFDACNLGAVAALKNAVFPAYDKKAGKVDHRTLTKEKLPLDESKIPILNSFVKIGDTLLVDPKLEEERVSDADFHIAISDEKICAIQKGGDTTLTEKEVFELIDEAVKYSKKNKKSLK